jgi:hypothetical protein
MLWRPQGRGPFPAILLNHGSGRTREDLERLGPYEQNAEKLGPVFAHHGYVFLYLFRRGVGLSTDQGANAVDLMNSESSAHGQEARNALQLQLLEHREMKSSRWELVPEWDLYGYRLFCRPAFELSEEHLARRHLWPGQSIRVGEGIPAQMGGFQMGDDGRFTIFLRANNNRSDALSTAVFRVDQLVKSTGAPPPRSH